MKLKSTLFGLMAVLSVFFTNTTKACDGLDVQAISVVYIGNGEYLVSIEYCEVVSNGVGASVHGILAEIVGANIVGTQTPSITSTSTGVTMNFNQINATSAEWGDWDNDAAPIFMDSGDPMECFTVTLICDAPPTSVTFAGSSNNTNIGGGFQFINGRWACVTTVIFPPPICISDWTPPTYCPGSTTPIDLNATTNVVGDWSGIGVDPATGMWDPTGQTGPVSVTLFVGDSAFNCQTTHDIVPIVSTYNVITNDITITCPEDSVEISGHADGGMTPWTYSWNTGATDSNTWVPGDQTATYTLTVNDACGGSEQGTVTVTYSPDPQPSISFPGGATQTICPGDQLNISATVTGGSGNNTYTWSTSNTFSPVLGTSQSITVSPTSDTWYYVEVFDGCWTVVDSMRVLMGGVDISQINLTPVTDCSGGSGSNNDGAIEVIPNPASGNYSFTCNPLGGTNATGIFTNLTSQSYQINITDNNSGCQTDTVIFLNSVVGAPPSIVSSSITHVSCSGAQDGCLDLVGINGTSGNLPFDITWTPASGAPIVETGVISGSLPQDHGVCNLYGSTWSVDITDQQGCSFNVVLVVNEPDPIDLGLTFDEPLCYGQSNGSIYVNATGGTLNYNVFIASTSDSVNMVTPGGNAAELLPTGWYYTSLEDGNGCIEADSIFLDQPDSMFANITTIDPPCYGEPFGEAYVSGLFNNQGSVNYSWAPGGQSDSSVNHLDQGSHTLTIVDSVGCIWQGDFTLTYPDSMYFTNLEALPSLCRGNGLYPGSGTVSASAAGGTGTITYSWVGNGETSITATWGNRTPGCYIIEATDANGCKIYDSICVDSLNPLADFIANPLDGTEPVTVTITDQSENRVTNTWSFSSTVDTNTIQNSFIIGYDSLQPPFDSTFMAGDYTICLVVANDFECYDTLCQTIEIYPTPDVELPNVITPNNDGFNDNWAPLAAGMETMSCTILNRWGNVIYQITEPVTTPGIFNASNSWDGTNQKSGNPVSDGVYSFIYTAVAQNGEEFSGHGFIHVVKE